MLKLLKHLLKTMTRNKATAKEAREDKKTAKVNNDNSGELVVIQEEATEPPDETIIAEVLDSGSAGITVPFNYSPSWLSAGSGHAQFAFPAYGDLTSRNYWNMQAGSSILAFPSVKGLFEHDNYLKAPLVTLGAETWASVSDSYITIDPGNFPFLSTESENSTVSVQDQIASYEDVINEHKEIFLKEFRYLLETEVFEFGIENNADMYAAEWINEHPTATRECLNTLFNSNISNPSIVAKILRIIGNLDYQLISPQGPTMAGLALHHKSTEVQECAIRAFENWGTLECLDILASQKYADKWLREYVDEVIMYLKEDLNVGSSTED